MIKAGIFLAAIKSFEALPDIIQLAVEDPAGRRNCVAPVDQTGESLNYNYISRGEERRGEEGREGNDVMILQTADIEH